MVSDMKNFITNETNSSAKSLGERLLELIRVSEELKFLVGFFYFSGIEGLYKSLKENPNVKMSVLVGLNVDKTNFGLIEYAENTESAPSNEEIRNRFQEEIKKSLNSDEFDTKNFYEQFKFFADMIKEGKLVIRKTIKPNHAKLYLFKFNESQIIKGLFITGSSNLTKAGISEQNEFNVEIKDYGFEDAEKYFDEFWKDAVPITKEDVVERTKFIETIKKQTLIRQITPFEAYLLVLKHYVETERKELGQSLKDLLKERGYKEFRYQMDAISQALSIIEKHNGVLIADVVGLGKSVIACAVAKELRKRGVVICPPTLEGDEMKQTGWQKYLEDFKLYDWEVWSLGKLDKALEFVRNRDDIEVVIVDEAHRFRNEDTKSYEYLKNICRGKIVLLLTATPFNNKPSDILSLLKLFVIPKKSSITLEENLEQKFGEFKTEFEKLAYIAKHYNSPDSKKREKARSYYESFFESQNIDVKKVRRYAQHLAKKIRDVIEPVTIRRNRLDLQNNPIYEQEVKSLSKIQAPEEWFFELTKEQSEFYDRVIKEYFGDPDEGGLFKGAIYRPFEYKVEKITEEKLSEKESFQYQQQRNLYDFMRRLLVKRFESSFGSFKESIENFKRFTENAKTFIEKTRKYILDRELLEDIYDLDIDEIEEHLEEYAKKLENNQRSRTDEIYKIDEFKRKEQFLEDINSDLELFNRILKELDEMKLVSDDPKSQHLTDPKAGTLVEKLKEVLNETPKQGEPRRKVVIFSEYLATVKYLEPILEANFPDRVLVVKKKISDSMMKELNENFDASCEAQSDKYDILLGTDRISEGLNLNRAGIVINYDIPWNPVRVIQRVGRINRISKKVFDELRIVNFFPTEKGEEIAKQREIASNKMFLIHNVLGEDAKIFDPNEEPTASRLYQKIQTNPDELEEESFYTKAFRLYKELKDKYPKLVKELDHFPNRVKVAKKGNENELLVFFKKDRLYICQMRYDDEKNIEQPSFEHILERIECTPDEEALSLSEKFWDAYEEIKNFRASKNRGFNNSREQSIEQKALNSLKALINSGLEVVKPYLDFLRTLREDINDYGTLPDYTLRRIANLSTEEGFAKNLESELSSLKNELGEDYLQKEQEKLKRFSKEIIVAIENQKCDA